MDARYKRTSLFRRIEKVTIHPKVASHFDMSSKTNNVVPPGKVAFVTGANGISGHAFIEHLIRTPESKWSKIIVTSRRPLLSSWLDPRVEFVALDFLEPAENIVIVIKTVCKDVTHTYFTSYVHSMDFSTLAEKNCPLFRNFLDAVDSACPKLERIRLQTGGKHYNVIRPMGIIGYTPQFNGMNEVIPLAQYFLICRELGETPKWPGNLRNYHRVEDQSYAPSIADLTVWATTQEHCKDEAFNHTNGDVIFYSSMPDREQRELDLVEWSRDKEEVWKSIVAKYGGRADCFQTEGFAMLNWGFNSSITSTTPFMSTVAKARKFGWTRIEDSYEAYDRSFKSYENAGILPCSRQFQ
ncbi:hypothetical protein PEX1_040960 [Penicillium expansum]|uniref:PRISE-like Rossmann-fold domain-containing protein n=1 Tax=Penicillium expansum TaxID=27334 RepID=A0A0A2IQH0_PENEN|nr:hypothetical protein PEX2_011900 [Penicillium expansum]KGO44678.1 hypothetical protein PEXP_019880 [Penicillium expansum]KGO50472.1 hypothetical protein PEX1_040960 [Penicillium expansum]KGO63401.1 hypothetical protein PEX2_011900 [Penicillium expansum]